MPSAPSLGLISKAPSWPGAIFENLWLCGTGKSEGCAHFARLLGARCAGIVCICSLRARLARVALPSRSGSPATTI